MRHLCHEYCWRSVGRPSGRLSDALLKSLEDVSPADMMMTIVMPISFNVQISNRCFSATLISIINLSNLRTIHKPGLIIKPVLRRSRAVITGDYNY